MGGGGGTTVEQAPRHTQPWGQLEQALAGIAVPGIGGMELAPAEFYGGQRLAEVSPEYLGYGSGALQNLAMPFEQFAQPALDLFQSRIAPEVMERFAGMGTAMSGGAALGLGRAGGDVVNQAYSDWIQSQQALPQLAQQFGTWEQMARQQPLDIAQQQWYEQTYPELAGPYFAAGKDILSGGGAGAMESYAEPGTDWGQVGGSLGSAALLGMTLGKSDKRLKDNIVPLRDALEKLKALSGWTFEFKGESGRRAGVMAQDVQEVLPEAVEERDGVLYVRLDGVIALLVEAVKELAISKGV